MLLGTGSAESYETYTELGYIKCIWPFTVFCRITVQVALSLLTAKGNSPCSGVVINPRTALSVGVL